jgi:hypothetical protein
MKEQIVDSDLWVEFQQELKKAESIKIEFPKSISANQSQGINTFFEIFLNEQLPEGKINTTLEKNFAVYIVQNQLDIEQVKAKYNSQSWKIGGLLGWIKKVVNGEIKELNIGEIIIWCKEFKPELIDLFQDNERKENPYNNLFYETKHLPMFKEFDKLISLYGKQYLCIKKARWYQLIGGILQKKIKLGKTETDTRVQVMYPLPTEAGKNSLIYAIKSLVRAGIKKENNKLFNISEPISYSAESLVGKYIDRLIPNPLGNKPKFIKDRQENRGHFDNDFLELDECTKLITSNEEEIVQAREYFSKAENTIGYNEVEKRLVDDLPTEAVSYCPKNTDSFYFQPSEKLPENIMTQGFMRRKIIPIGNIKKFLIEANLDLINAKLESEEDSKGDISVRLIKYLEKIKTNLSALGYEGSYTFTEEAKQSIAKYTLIILDNQGKSHSEKIANFCKINKYTTTEYLIKMSCILASAYGTTQVNEKFVALAFMDLTEFMQNTYDFIYSNVKGSFDYGTQWQGAGYYDIQCLKYLYDNKALSFESSNITNSDFEAKIMEIYPNNIKEEMAKKHRLRMAKENWINCKQEGQHSSKVWLKFNPELIEELNEVDKAGKGWKVYETVFLGINEVLATLHSLHPLPT